MTTLNQAYFALFNFHQDKLVRARREIKNIIPDELHLFEKKCRIEDIHNTSSSLLILGILILL